LFESETEGKLLDEKIIQKQLVPQNLNKTLLTTVKNISLDNKIQGQLFYPKNLEEVDYVCFKQKKLPAIITIGGLLGAPTTTLSASLANHGYVVFSMAWKGVHKMVEKKDFYDLNYYENCLNYVKSLNFVRSDRVGILGLSRGGEIAYMMGKNLNKDKAIKFIATTGTPLWNSCFHSYVYNDKEVLKGSVAVFEQEMIKRNNSLARAIALEDIKIYKAFSQRNESFLKIAKQENLGNSIKYHTKTGGLIASEFMKSYASENLCQMINIDEINCPIHAAHGTYDLNVPTDLVESLSSKNSLFLKVFNQTDRDLKIYPKAGHILDVPYTGFTHSPEWPKSSGLRMSRGGEAVAHGEATVENYGEILGKLENFLKS